MVLGNTGNVPRENCEFTRDDGDFPGNKHEIFTREDGDFY